MDINGNKLYFHRLLLSFCVGSGIFSITNPERAIAENISAIRILRVITNSSTVFKQPESWYQQSVDIENDKKCFAKKGEKFFISSLIKHIQTAPIAPKGNYEQLADYWEVTFQKPLPCELQGNNNPTWFVYRKHVQELRAVPLR
jgi:hypothetical protein